jgi:site-specific recombinase XerC
MLHLCFSAGLRVSELIGVRMNDLKLQADASVLVHGKGRKQRCLPLWKQTASALRAWLGVSPHFSRGIKIRGFWGGGPIPSDYAGGLGRDFS